MSDSYDAIARVYDVLWGPLSARRYVPAVERWLSEAIEADAEIVDLACGTGQVAAALAGRGYRVAGVDGSARMIERAQANAPHADLRVATLERLPFASGRFAAALCMFDSLNHIAPAALPAVLAETARVLRPSGLLIFDVNTEEGFRQRWHGSSAEVRGDLVCVTRARYAADRGVGEYFVTAFEPTGDGTWTRADVTLREYVHQPADLKDVLAAAGFSQIDVHDSERDLGITGDTGRDFYRARTQGGAAP